MTARNTAIVLMGVSGAGKSTIGVRLAQKLHREFLEGDSFHPLANVEKMSRGAPLDDDDRLPWLTAIAAAIDAARQAGRQLVVTCSALKRSYRTILSAGHDDVAFVYLRGGRELIAERLALRAGHFMPPKLLDSQFAALEEPAGDERPVIVAIEDTPDQIVSALAVMFAADLRT
jgi:carbohydrate kinase (thermoresistant glucokinase family)